MDKRPSAPGARDEALRASAGPGVELDIVDHDRLLSVDRLGWLTLKAAEALAVLGCRGTLSVRVVGDAAMAAAHEQYKQVPGTTDVLTFDLSDDDLPDDDLAGDGLAGDGPGVLLEADLLICADEAGRQGRARGHAQERELLLYVVHGVLHCLGHDDHDEAEAARMHAEEDRVLTAIGVGATFAREASS